jgi:uncharacterized protein YhdP
MIEVFVNERHAVVAWHEYPPENQNVSLFRQRGRPTGKKSDRLETQADLRQHCVFTPAPLKKNAK